MIETNETLLGRLKAETAHEAWREFYEHYWGAILRYARKLGLDEILAQEVLQETMVALMRILPEFAYDRNKGRFRNFLLTIVHRKSLAALRRVRRERESQVPWEDGDGVEPAKPFGEDRAAESAAIEAWREVLLAEALGELRADPGLAENTFAVFEAYVIEKRPVGEVAAAFGLKENAVYQIKNRVLRRLRDRVTRLMRDSGAEWTDPRA